jgi:hypothetical protein
LVASAKRFYEIDYLALRERETELILALRHEIKQVKEAVKADVAASELCGEALDGATRCAEMIARLLAFARRQSLHPEQIDVNKPYHRAELARAVREVLDGDDDQPQPLPCGQLSGGTVTSLTAS